MGTSFTFFSFLGFGFFVLEDLVEIGSNAPHVLQIRVTDSLFVVPQLLQIIIGDSPPV
ncbi:MAG: hypothetical protein KGD65_04055 [Candidatus Lokiarchaeota archaeon]|nr:hypothetical protein [Candidatus Lokiarchaeota archaeon]